MHLLPGQLDEQRQAARLHQLGLCRWPSCRMLRRWDDTPSPHHPEKEEPGGARAVEEDTEAEEEAAQVPTHAAHQGEAQTETTTPTTAEPGIKGSCLPLQRPGRMLRKKTRSDVCFSVDRLTSPFSRTLKGLKFCVCYRVYPKIF